MRTFITVLLLTLAFAGNASKKKCTFTDTKNIAQKQYVTNLFNVNNNFVIKKYITNEGQLAKLIIEPTKLKQARRKASGVELNTVITSITKEYSKNAQWEPLGTYNIGSFKWNDVNIKDQNFDITLELIQYEHLDNPLSYYYSITYCNKNLCNEYMKQFKKCR